MYVTKFRKKIPGNVVAETVVFKILSSLETNLRDAETRMSIHSIDEDMYE